MAKTLGLIDVLWNGTKIDVEKGGKVRLGGIQQKPVVYGQQIGFSAEYVSSEIKCTTVLKKGQSLVGIFTSGVGELQVQCDTGQTYTFSDAFISKRPDFTAGDGGKVPIEWMAGEAVELVTT